ncbi:MAG: pentapeptide repeat-containing protein [Planctomycetota bacterium]
MDISTLIAILAFMIPIVVGLFQYRQSVQQNQDKNFREEIVKLTSKEREERLAAATNMGTFIVKGNRFYEEVVTILVNRASVELDYNVLSAMVGSLRRVDRGEYRGIIQNLVDIERSFFIQKYPLKKWRDQTDVNLKKVQTEFKKIEDAHKTNGLEYEKVMLDNLNKEIQLKWVDFLFHEKNFNELEMHSQAIGDFISTFLGVVTKSFPISGLEFNKNSLNNTIMEDISLIKSNFKASAFSSTQILQCRFDESSFINTVFTYSPLMSTSFRNCKLFSVLWDYTNLTDVDFSGSEFDDNFFMGADLTRANFRKTKGLKPVFFYLARNVDKAHFDGNFGKEIQSQLLQMTQAQFEDYAFKCNITKQRRDALFFSLDDLAPKKST